MPRNLIKLVLTLSLVLITREVYCLELNSMKTKMLGADYKAAISEGEELIAQGEHSDELDYLLGLCYLKDGNYPRALVNFEAIIKESSGSRFQEEARLGLGDTYLLRDDLAKAEESYLGLLKSNPDTKLKAQVFYRLSEIGFKKGDAKQGGDYLAKLNEGYPLNPEVKQKRDIFPAQKVNADSYYAVQVGSFSNSTNAANLTRKLLNSGYPAYTEESPGASGSKTYRVKVGRLNSRQEAEELNRKLKQEGYPTKICP